MDIAARLRKTRLDTSHDLSVGSWTSCRGNVRTLSHHEIYINLFISHLYIQHHNVTTVRIHTHFSLEYNGCASEIAELIGSHHHSFLYTPSHNSTTSRLCVCGLGYSTAVFISIQKNAFAIQIAPKYGHVGISGEVQHSIYRPCPLSRPSASRPSCISMQRYSSWGHRSFL